MHASRAFIWNAARGGYDVSIVLGVIKAVAKTAIGSSTARRLPVGTGLIGRVSLATNGFSCLAELRHWYPKEIPA